MNIVDRLHKRIQDFESVLEATKDVSWDEDFEWRGQIYHSYEEWADKYSGWGGSCGDDRIYRAIRFEMSNERNLEYFLFFPKIPRVDYVYGDEKIVFTEFPYCEEFAFLIHFYHSFVKWAY